MTHLSSRSSKVVEFGTNWSSISNLGAILPRFRHITVLYGQTDGQTTCHNTTALCVGNKTLNFSAVDLFVCKLRS